jgi:regulator of replication initiation timing
MDMKKLRELCEKATPGPWNIFEDFSSLEIHAGEVLTKASGVIQANWVCSVEDVDANGNNNHSNDAEFIAAARTALPEALDEIEWYEQNKTQLEQQVDELIDENDRLRTEIKKVIENAKNNNPYPVDIFPELTKEEVSKLREVFKEKGINQARLYASWGRRVWDDCLQEIESLLEVEE